MNTGLPLGERLKAFGVGCSRDTIELNVKVSGVFSSDLDNKRILKRENFGMKFMNKTR